MDLGKTEFPELGLPTTTAPDRPAYPRCPYLDLLGVYMFVCMFKYGNPANLSRKFAGPVK
jgi:hypothetical protein